MYLHSPFYRNGEDAEFYYPEVMELALEVMEGPHDFEIGLGYQGLELTFTSQTYKVEVVLESFLKGTCSITDAKPRRSACLPHK
ncbi:hypothetical protein [Pontibacter kalidii]|uniref:hypothetical protein n=1 Tax=Pontibacter kalidii TaxID=2592049 RepID=UPI002258DE66|nr:hypothetical protein [Pontibacter kalidii]